MMFENCLCRDYFLLILKGFRVQSSGCSWVNDFWEFFVRILLHYCVVNESMLKANVQFMKSKPTYKTGLPRRKVFNVIFPKGFPSKPMKLNSFKQINSFLFLLPLNMFAHYLHIFLSMMWKKGIGWKNRFFARFYCNELILHRMFYVDNLNNEKKLFSYQMLSFRVEIVNCNLTLMNFWIEFWFFQQFWL